MIRKPQQGKAWRAAEIDLKLAEQLAAAANLSPLLARLLVRRGVRPDTVDLYLNPELLQLADPFLLPDMEAAVDRVLEALHKKEKILVHGDYDVDGITSSALLVRFFRELHYPVESYLPNRLEEGHGIGQRGVELCKEQGIRLVISVDCGITSIEAIEVLAKEGIDTIVLDHHRPKDILPKCVAAVDPKRDGSAFPFDQLAGVGVAFFFLLALRKRMRSKDFFSEAFVEPNLKKYLDLVALGTIADVVPLIDQNRILVMHGLAELARTLSPGIASLKMQSGLKAPEINVGQVAFVLAPRINAMGRLGMPQRGLKLLTSEKMEECLELALEIEGYNQQRKKIEEEISVQAIRQVEEQGLVGRHSLVLDHKDWHSGVVGIVASRLAERYGRPAVLLCHEGQVARGSARGISNFDLLAAMEQSAECLRTFGGHRAAAGLQLDLSQLDQFRILFEKACHAQLGERELIAVSKYDCELELGQIDFELLTDLQRMQPHGSGNPEPQFLAKGLRVERLTILKESHFKASFVDQRGHRQEGIAFNMLPPGGSDSAGWDLLYTPQINEWQGQRRIQLKIKDFKLF